MKIASSTAQLLRGGVSATAIGRALSRFRREEDGNMTVFSLYLFLMMLMVGGLGVDFMRLESERVGLQGAIDRAVLAAADLDQTLDQRAVIVDMLEKEGQKHRVPDENIILPGDEGAPPFASGAGYASVSGTIVLDTLLMRLVGITQIASGASAVATEDALNYEISLVLDISGSMNRSASGSNTTRISALRDAATAFVNTAIPEPQSASDQALTSISIIPYNAQVVLPYEFFVDLGIEEDHEFSHCVYFEGGDFDILGIDDNDLPQQYAHIDHRNSNSDNFYEDHPDYDNPEQRVARVRCFRTLESENAGVETKIMQNPMIIHETDAGVLTDIISTYTADGATSIDQAAKWGFALLDPSLQDAVADNSGGLADGRPYVYDSDFSQKVLVLMTDGRMNHKTTWRPEIQAHVDAGLKSNLFYSEENDHTSVLLSGCKEDDGITDRPPEQCINRIVALDDDGLPFDETNDWWYWGYGDGFLPWPDTPAARVVENYVDDYSPSGDRFDQTALEAAMEAPGVDPDDKDLWDQRADWDYISAELERHTWAEVFDRYVPFGFVQGRYQDAYEEGFLSEGEWEVYKAPYLDDLTSWVDADGNGEEDSQDLLNSTAETNLKNLCDLAKAQDVIIYGVTLNMPDDPNDDNEPADLIKYCASTASNYINVDDENIDTLPTVFSDIARQIVALRLTQ